MSRSHHAAVATLVRWRSLQEAVAETASRRALAEVHMARTAREHAEASADAIDARRVQALSTGQLDMGLLDALGVFAAHARDALAARDAALTEAEAHRDEAIARQWEARTQTRVASTRHARLAAQERDAEDKRIFDRMAALIAATPREHADD